MKRRFISALISTSLVIPATVVSMPVMANEGVDQTMLQSVSDPQAKWAQGSAGFFQYLADQGDSDARLAYRIITAKDTSLQDGDKKSTNYSSYTRLGQDKDATSLDNMKLSLDFLEETNAKRQEENRTMHTNLSDLKVSSSLMAISQWQTNASRENTDHSDAFNVGENLSWGNRDPFTAWYDKEKEVDQEYQSRGETAPFSKVGHYRNIVSSSYQVMGSAAIENGNSQYGRVAGQTFSSLNGKYAAKTYTVDQYKKLFNDYYNDLKSQLNPVKTDLSSAIISGVSAQYEYQGQAISPVPTVTLNGTVLSQGTDYTVVWSNNTGPGSATVTITGTGSYTGSVTATFFITEPGPAIVHSGKIGTADWTIDENGVLTIGEGEFTNNFQNSDIPWQRYEWPWTQYQDSIVRVDGTAKFKISGSMADMFGTLTTYDSSTFQWSSIKPAIESADLSGWDTSGVTDMRRMFDGCSDLSSINLDSWNTSAVENMSYMFSACHNLRSASVSNLVTSAATNIHYMFDWCDNLESLNVSQWNTSNVTDLSGIFNNCSSLTSLDIARWDTSKAKDISGLFGDCSGLTSLDVSKWDTSSVEDMSGAFSGCSALRSLDLSKWNTSAVKNMSMLFERCSTLTTLQISQWNTSHVTNMGWMFMGCSGLTSLSLSGWNLSEIPDSREDMMICGLLRMFEGCSRLSSLDISWWDTSHIAVMDDIFADCPSLSRIFYSQKAANILSKLPEQSGWYQNNNGPYSVPNLPVVATGNIAQLTRTPDSYGPQDINYIKGVGSVPASSYTYTGKAITPEIVISTLVKDKDFTYTYFNNVNPGTATMIVTGIGNYTGTMTYTFKIVKAQIGSAAVTGINSSYSHTGKAISPKPVVTLEGKRLTEGIDYTVSYSNNVNPGKATVTITGKGGYTGTITRTFTITKPAAMQIGSASVTGINSSYTQTGKAITPKPVVTLGGKKLTEGTDYTVSYSGNVNPGKATVTITGKGGYTGTITKTFTIVKAPENKPAETVKSVEMYRLYNPNSGEHFYTANPEEKDHLVVVGWKYEGIGWKAPQTSKIPVYRLYNPNAGDHHYTMGEGERDALVKVGWKYEGIGWYSDETKGVPLYRQYNPNAVAGSHNYTIDKGENDGLVRLGWKAEGIGWYGMK